MAGENSGIKFIREIRVRGFKSILKLDMEMKPINILIGANGSGKSNFISLFTFLRNLSEGRLRNYVEKSGFADTFFHFGSKNTKAIEIGVLVDINGYFVTFEHGSNDTLVFSDEYCTISSTSRRYAIRGESGESGLLPGSYAESELVRNYTRNYLEQCRVYHFHDTSPSADFKQAVNLDSNDYLYGNAGNLAALLYRLKVDENSDFINGYFKIVDAIRTVAPYFKDFYLEPRGSEGQEKILLKWLHKDVEEPFSANQLSDGTARFICLATLFLQPISLRPKTIIIDEPELGLHPAALEVLAEIIKYASKENQIICSTQSVTFSNQFSSEDFIVVDQEDGISTFKRVDALELQEWLDDYSMGDIWLKNLIGGRPEW